MKKLLLSVILFSLCLSPADAQRRKTKTKTKKVEVIEKTPEEKLYEELLPSTAKVMFIDSVVVDKKDFLRMVPMSSDMGKMYVDGEKVVYTNEFGSTMLYASGDTISGRDIYITNKYGEKWETPRQLTEVENKMKDYPFLMSDGVTLYFSAEGDGTIGGRDIFRTTYNADAGVFYEAINMGMPYNSTANDYMLAISDMDNLGWLVTDRNQPEGKVCIYTFEPTAQRETFGEDTDTEILQPYAKISRISDTWQFGKRDEALERKAAMLSRMNRSHSSAAWQFVVNDNTTYTKLSDFKSKENRIKFEALLKTKNELKELSTLLDNARERYATAQKTKKHEIGRQIVSLEKEVMTLEENVLQTEKEIRNDENK